MKLLIEQMNTGLLVAAAVLAAGTLLFAFIMFVSWLTLD
jgi:hypothetical protein